MLLALFVGTLFLRPSAVRVTPMSSEGGLRTGLGGNLDGGSAGGPWLEVLRRKRPEISAPSKAIPMILSAMYQDLQARGGNEWEDFKAAGEQKTLDSEPLDLLSCFLQ